MRGEGWRASSRYGGLTGTEVERGERGQGLDGLAPGAERWGLGSVGTGVEDGDLAEGALEVQGEGEGGAAGERDGEKPHPGQRERAPAHRGHGGVARVGMASKIRCEKFSKACLISKYKNW